MSEYAYGMVGGVLGTIMSHPIDTLKTLTQTNKTINVKRLYKGVVPPLIGIGIEKSIVFGTFYNLENTQMNTFTKGIIAGLCSTVIVSPVEQIKIQMQTNRINSSIDFIRSNRSLYKLYNGWGATLFREVPGYGFYFLCYENIKSKNDTSFQTFIKGGLSGCFSWLFIYPFDYIKTQKQYNNINYSNTLTTVYKTKNIFSLYRGFSFSLLRCFPLHGGVFLGYELCSLYVKG